MATDQPDRVTDLGAGVRLTASADGSLVVRSDHLDLGWQEPRGRVPGTGVLWQDQLYGVLTRNPAGGGCCWTLRPWPANEPQRAVCRLDRESVSRAEQEFQEQQRAGRRRHLLVPLLPLLGLAPGKLQQRWWHEWQYPAPLATTLSCVLELLVGGIGVLQSFLLVFGGDLFLPAGLRWLGVAGPVLFAEGMIRFVYLSSQGEVLGTLIGAPLLLLERKQTPPALQLQTAAPEVRRLDTQAGVLELWSAERRNDWHEPGLLPYRGLRFLLEGHHQEGHGWRYTFHLPDEATLAACSAQLPDLRLLPPVQQAHEHDRAGLEVGFFRMILVTTLICLAPQEHQQRWAARVGTQAIWFTLCGAMAELLGGAAQIKADLQTESPMLLLDLFLLGEGLLRLVAAAVTRQPVSSLLGLPLRRLYDLLIR